jgi:L,D-transpeptidase-like protein/Big-like domain-containing protein
LSVIGRFRGRIAALGGVIVVVLAAGTWIALSHASARTTAATQSSGSQGASAPKPKVPLRVVAVTPAKHTRHVNGSSPLRVTFSAALASDSPMPTVKPAVAGTWQPAGSDAVEFVPAHGFKQYTHVKVHVPGGASGVRSASGQTLPHTRTVRFETGGYSSSRLTELLAQLHYLPLKWTPTAGQSVPSVGSAAGQLAAAYAPPSGTFHWKHGYPHQLHAFWDHGSPSGLIMRGAVMAFESDHGLTLDGVAGPQVWKDLLSAAAKAQANGHGYTYAIASQHAPETLTVWHDGKVILHTAANTGIPAAPTTVGTAPVYLRYSFQIMKGRNPDGTKYADPVKWVSYFRSGEAVHYFPRASYGFQQSLGCVELPLAQSHYIWPYMTYGTLVTVTPA